MLPPWATRVAWTAAEPGGFGETTVRPADFLELYRSYYARIIALFCREPTYVNLGTGLTTVSRARGSNAQSRRSTATF